MLGLAAYIAAIFVLKTVIFSSGIGHDSNQLFYAQSFEFSYDGRNPPLYTWLVLITSLVMGVSLGATIFVKCVVFFLIFLFLFLAGRRMFGAKPLALAAAFGIAGMYEFAWWLPQKFSHSALVTAAVAATFYAFLRVQQRGSRFCYAIFGIAIGLGALSKYNYLLFLASFVAAALMAPATR